MMRYMEQEGANSLVSNLQILPASYYINLTV